ncbi:MAG TPA: TetR family transcriptional regulator [Ideonella sp.]|uniref:TetR/AcrR family transcriptional regulator n=1 Tax=Ideonella sp. TaxID=1929293 RepID=UPI002BBF2275|nr:TetR family transcriptional regulator [Ideonella sp.]
MPHTAPSPATAPAQATPKPRPAKARASPAEAQPAQRRAPASAKSEQRIKDILRAGREVFAQKGYERATTTEIAQRLGVSEATVFTYFRGKRELCERVIHDWYDEIIAAIETGLPREQGIRAQLQFIVHTHLRLFLDQGTGLCALVLSEGRAKGQSLGDSLLPLQRRYTAPLMDLLARGQASGEIRADMPLRLLRPLVFGPMEHLLWEAVGQDKPIDIEPTADALVTLLWSALQAPDAELAALRRLRDEVSSALRR